MNNFSLTAVLPLLVARPRSRVSPCAKKVVSLAIAIALGGCGANAVDATGPQVVDTVADAGADSPSTTPDVGADSPSTTPDAGADSPSTTDAGADSPSTTDAGAAVEAAVPAVMTGLSTIAFGGGVFVAAGAEWVEVDGQVVGDQFDGVVYSSTDALAWTRTTQVRDVPVNDVCFGNGHFVVVASPIGSGSSLGKTLVSDNGRDWTAVDVAPPFLPRQCEFGNGIFVARGTGGPRQSTDGLLWNELNPPDALGEPGAIAFGAGRFVGWDLLHKSVSVWSGAGSQVVQPVDGASYNTLLAFGFVGNRFEAVTVSYPPYNAPTFGRLTSDDGLTWSVAAMYLPAEPPATLIRTASGCVASQSVSILSGKDCDSLATRWSVAHSNPAGGVFANGMYVVVDTLGIAISTDAITWKRTLATPQ